MRVLKPKPFNTWRKTGVFREHVNGVTVGYFVGWRYHYGNAARNIREGLYFETPEAAIEWRDKMEAGRMDMTSAHEQIA